MVMPVEQQILNGYIDTSKLQLQEIIDRNTRNIAQWQGEITERQAKIVTAITERDKATLALEKVIAITQDPDFLVLVQKPIPIVEVSDVSIK